MTKFELTPEEEKKTEKWQKSQIEKDPTTFLAGERWTFSFTPTGLGTLKSVHDNLLNEDFTISGTEDW
jgi:hypothetical protein